MESVLSEDDEETESESEDEFVPKDFVAIREGDVQKFYCIEEEVGRYVNNGRANNDSVWNWIISIEILMRFTIALCGSSYSFQSYVFPFLGPHLPF